LSEINYGQWEGELWNELPAKDPQGFAAREADRWGWRPTGGESYRDLSARVAGWLGEVERDAVVVAHGGVMRVLRGLSMPLQPAEIFLLDVPQDKVLVIEAGRTRCL
jgi:broad specificity phosphatase PhoE